MNRFTRYSLLPAFVFMAIGPARAQFPTDPRSDSLDITRQSIELDITDLTGRTINGHSDIYVTAKTGGVKGIYLDLFRFTVDSVKIGTNRVNFGYNDSLLRIPFATPMATGDSAHVSVWYRGEARQGSGGWGGFYWSQGIAFNMGVTLYDVPHGAGRFWFPCFDNFTEKAYYTVSITTQGNHSAICGGTLLSRQDNPNLTKTWHWKLNRPVPSYLVSVAVGPFAFVHKTYTGRTGPVPVILASLPADSTAMKNSFVNLEPSFHIYEQFYGPYLWERVGYVLVPFNGGAMEHATNIAYQQSLVNGTVANETVMAHELSHHWWGDLVTCETAEDMWINEGMAVFSEYLFLEQRYNRARALTEIRTNHSSVIRTAHISDNGYHPLSGLPQAYTYGKHSYEKGANVAWSLRGYMGDSLFFKGLRAVLNARRFGNVNAPEFRDILSDSTGYDAGPFFADWIQQPGFAEFLLDSFAAAPQGGGQFLVNVYTSQRLRAADHLFTQVPLELSFVGANRQQVTRTLMHSGALSQGTFQVPFEPLAVFVNRNEKLLYAVTADEREIKTAGSNIISLSFSNFRYKVNAVTDSALLRTEYHWVRPDGSVDQPWRYELTPDRFWKIDGIFPAGFDATATFTYDGTASGPDYPLIYVEDSVQLFYRRNSIQPWKPAENYTLNTQAANDKKGQFTGPLRKGEYCIGTKRAVLSFGDADAPGEFILYPNPSRGEFTLRLKEGVAYTDCRVQVTDTAGKTVFTGKPEADGRVRLKNPAAGTYTVRVFSGNAEIGKSLLLLNP